MTKPLVVFDIDGTLTDTYHLDDGIFIQAFAEHLAIDDMPADWSAYESCTDSGVAQEIFQQHRGRDHLPDEIEAIQARYFVLLRDQIRQYPQRCQPIQGAPELMMQLREQGFELAIATGAWGQSARLKLQHAGIPHQDLTLACSDDALKRSVIIQTAIERSKPAQRVIYVGDGPWDYRATQELGIEFIGVGSKLAEAGIACNCIENYQQDDFFALLEP